MSVVDVAWSLTEATRERTEAAVLAEAVNAVQVSPLLHGETAAIDTCARSHPGVDWPALSLYTTAEPCPMCAAAIAWTRIGEVIVGSDTPTLAGLGIDQPPPQCLGSEVQLRRDQHRERDADRGDGD